MTVCRETQLENLKDTISKSLRSLVATGLITLAFAATVEAGPSCGDLFSSSPADIGASPAFPQDPLTVARVSKEIRQAKKVSNFFMRELRKTSDRIKNGNRNKIIELDWLCLGAGPQCASQSLVLGKTGLKSMVLERSDWVAKTFAEKDFIINSVETETRTMHEFPGGVGSLSDLTSQKYPNSLQLAAYIQEQQYASNVPVLLGTAMTDARIVVVNGKEMVEIKTDQGITIRTAKLTLGTGLGDVVTKVRDENYKMAFDQAIRDHQADPSALFPIMATDTFLTAIKNAKVALTKLRLPRRLILIGNGDGSRICIEALRDPNIEIPDGFQITWIGNNFKTAEQYVASRDGGDRYIHKIVPFYQANQITGQSGHVQSWEAKADGTMIVTTKDKETGISATIAGEMIIDSTGYENTLPRFLTMLGAQATLADVIGPLPDMNLPLTVLARQAVSPEGRRLPIYAVGASAGALATKEELAEAPNKNPMAIFNTVARTSMATSILTGTTPFDAHRGARAGRGPVKTPEQIIEEAKRRRREQSDAAEKSAGRTEPSAA